MKLQEFFDHMELLVTGSISPEDAFERLYGQAAVDPLLVSRLSVYTRSYHASLHRQLDTMFPNLKRAFEFQGQPRLWHELASKFFQAHPPYDFSYIQACLPLTGFLRDFTRQYELPPWFVEVADLELWRHLIDFRPLHASDERPHEGALRLASTAELRDYDYDVLHWVRWRYGANREELMQIDEQAPVKSPTIVLLWRDGRLRVRIAPMGRLELSILKMIYEEGAIDYDQLDEEPTVIKETMVGMMRRRAVLGLFPDA